MRKYYSLRKSANGLRSSSDPRADITNAIKISAERGDEGEREKERETEFMLRSFADRAPNGS